MNLTLLNVCSVCDSEKEIDVRYNLYKPCKICSKKYHEKFYQSHKELLKEKQRQYFLQNPGKKKEYDARYYRKHRDIILEKKARLYLENKKQPQEIY